MSPETQKRIMKALDQMSADLRVWLSGLGLSEAQIMPLYYATLREDGILAMLVKAHTTDVFPMSKQVDLRPENVAQEFARYRSGELASGLLTQPEPTSEELDKLLNAMKNALPNLRKRFELSAKLGPRLRRGGRPKELSSAEVRQKIREDIKNLRDPGTTLEDLYKRLARKHRVSPSTIKRIWNEKTTQSKT